MAKHAIFGLLFLRAVFSNGLLFGQGIELETLPASTKWSQINTPNFDVIFPNGFELEANRTANILETIHTPASQSLGVKPRKFSIILQNQNAISNGFVTIGPRRSEFFTTSIQDNKFLGNAEWIEFLAVHEYRHMVQFEKAYHSPINKVMYWAFGEYGLGFAAGIAAPSWFWEGDAVGIETAFTKTGRGRIPNFELEFKTNLLEKGGFNYSKQNLTSFKDFVPNHYRTGFFMTTYLKRKYGVDIWDKVIKRSYSFPFLPFAFSNAIKKETGQNLLQTYAGMMSEMEGLYRKQVDAISKDKSHQINVRTNTTFTNYHYPHFTRDNKFIALKSGFSDTDKFVQIDTSGNETTLFTTGIMNDPGFLSFNNDKVLWTEFEFDPRWLKKTYSVIKVFDLKDQSFKRITKKTKYVSAAISPDGKLIAAIENSIENKYSIHLIESTSGAIIKKFENSDNHYYSMPSFSSNGEELVLVKRTKDKKHIVTKNVSSGLEEILIETQKENFGHPILTDKYLFYNSPMNGIDNIYTLDLRSKEIFQVTHSRLGAFNPSISKDGSKMVYNEFGKDGMDILTVDLNASNWTSITDVTNRNINYALPMVESEGHEEVLENLQTKKYDIKPYKKIKRTIRPHSWGLSAIPTNTSLILGVNSQDVLSTTTISAGLQYDSDERNWLKFGSISYQGLYPIIDIGILDGTRSTNITIDGARQTFNWQETSFSAGLRVPLLLTNSKYLRKLTFSSKSEFTSVSEFNLPPDRIFIDQARNGNLRALEHSIRFNNNLRRSKLDLYSKFGQTFAIHYLHTPIGGDYNSELFAAETNLFLPGLVKHHSIRLRGTYQHENAVNYFFDSPIRFTRGFGYFPFRNFTNWSVNYKMPLWYPDVHIGPLLNIQRIYVNGFYDKGLGTFPQQANTSLRSYGAELSFNFNLMRFRVLFDLGLRYSYMPDFNDRRIEVILGTITF